jgi:hypothetical protein
MLVKTRLLIFLNFFLLITACKTLQPVPTGFVNYGFINNFIDDSLSFKINLFGDFVFNNQKLSDVEKRILFKPTKFLYEADQTILGKDKTFAALYPDSNLSAFSNNIVSQLKHISKVDSIHEVKSDYSKFSYSKSGFLLNNAIPFKVFEYIINDSHHQKVNVIEQQLINPYTKKGLRFIWLADFEVANKSAIFKKITTQVKESFYYASGDTFSSLVFYMPDTDPFALAGKNFNDDAGYSYNFPLNLLKAYGERHQKDPLQTKDVYFQARMTYDSFAGNLQAVRHFDSMRSMRGSDSNDVKKLRLYDTISARKYILKVAKNHQILMFNEAHHWPQARAFLRDMLVDLKAIGYNKIAMEAIDNYTDNIENIKQPSHSIGLYTSEPMYGQLIREANKLGFKIIPYEDTVKCKSDDYRVCENQREKNEALNIYNSIKKDSLKDGKLIVFAGYGHIYKKQNDDWPTMAKYFMDFSNIIPVCFDLTRYYERETPEMQSPIYNMIIDKYKPEVPMILIDSQQHAFVPHSETGMIDASIFLPKGGLETHEFPLWYNPKDAVESVIDLKRKTTKRMFLQIFLNEEAETLTWNAVPFMNQFIKSETEKINVFLVKGVAYKYELKDPSTNKTVEYGLINP